MFLNHDDKRPKVGVAVIILKDGKVLMQRRQGTHGAGTWSFPGGHLEFGESFEDCAHRETLEEVGIIIKNLKLMHVTNDLVNDEGTHYITVFMLADYSSGEPRVCEPDKSDACEWVDWDCMPRPLFFPIVNLMREGVSPFRELLSKDQKVIIEKTYEYVARELSSAESGHDMSHIDRVYKTARQISKTEECDHFVVELASLLHDIADHKFNNGDTEAGAQKARQWLMSIGVDLVVATAVADIVRHISFKHKDQENKISTIEGKIVQDADRLDALGAIGIARAFAYGGHKNRSIQNSIDHFHEKLLLLKDRMNTKLGRELALERHAFLEDYLEQYNLEQGNQSSSKIENDYKTETLRAYEKYPKVWEEKFQAHFDRGEVDYAEQFVSRLQGGKVVDIGSGPGSASVYFKNRGLQVEALDISPAMIEICKEKGLNARVFDVENDDLGIEQYDGIWSYACLLHLPKKNVPGVIEKIARALKPQGVFALALKIGDEEGFEERKKFPETKRWFSHFKDEEIRDMVKPHFEVLSSHYNEVRDHYGETKYTFGDYLLRKL